MPDTEPHQAGRGGDQRHAGERRRQRVALDLELHVQQLVPSPVELTHQLAELLPQAGDLALELARRLAR